MPKSIARNPSSRAIRGNALDIGAIGDQAIKGLALVALEGLVVGRENCRPFGRYLPQGCLEKWISSR
jgi:hypothetical protein